MGGPGQHRQEAKAAFLLGLRARGVGDLQVLRAMETVPREIFVPHRYADLAGRDMALPIACGQTMPAPYFLARVMAAAALAPGLRVLEIGAGSGYGTAILARLAGEVVALERFQTLAISAMARLEKLGIRNAAIVRGDGLAISRAIGRFDRIVVHALLETAPDNLLAALGPDGVLVSAATAGDGTQMLRSLAPAPGGGLAAAMLCPSRLRPLIPGVSQAL